MKKPVKPEFKSGKKFEVCFFAYHMSLETFLREIEKEKKKYGAENKDVSIDFHGYEDGDVEITLYIEESSESERKRREEYNEAFRKYQKDLANWEKINAKQIKVIAKLEKRMMEDAKKLEELKGYIS